MISLKKLIDSTRGGLVQAQVPPSEPPERCSPQAIALLAAYQSTLTAMSSNGRRAIPALGPMIQAGLAPANESLNCHSSPESILTSGHMVEAKLVEWADKAQEIQKQGEQTITDLLRLISESTESTGNRDEKFGREIAELSERLRRVAGLESLPVIRRSITENAVALTSCVARMVVESREAVRKLTSEVADYQVLLVASERRALADPLTGLCNRRGFEQQLELSVQRGKSFSVLVVDLNGFKLANDQYGHLVGDEILRKFAAELKSQFAPEDIVARWGGDEFAVLVDGPPHQGIARAERIQHRVLGEYKIVTESRTISIVVDAALGFMAWNGVESGQELFARADKEMYRTKVRTRELV